MQFSSPGPMRKRRPITSRPIAPGPGGARRPADDAVVGPSFQYLALLLVAALFYVLIKCVLTTLSARVHLELQRHNVIRKAKQRRLDYLAQLAERREETEDSVVVEEA